MLFSFHACGPVTDCKTSIFYNEPLEISSWKIWHNKADCLIFFGGDLININSELTIELLILVRMFINLI